MKKYYVEFDFMRNTITGEVKPMQMKIFTDLEDAEEFAYQVEGEIIEEAA